MKRAWLLLVAAAPAALVAPAISLAAQRPPRPPSQGPAATGGVVLDAYSFGSQFAFHHVMEWTMPVVLWWPLGPRVSVDLSSAYVRATGSTTSGTFTVDGFTDTDLRLSWTAVSGHLIVSAAGALPTGRQSVPDSTLPLLGALATDLLGFTTPGFGSGGGLTGGFVTAFPLGERWAGGVAGSYRWHASYTPVSGGAELEPGGDGRVRIGVEGPLGGSGYFRGAAVYTASGADSLNGGSRSVTGDRILVYTSLNLPAGAASLGLYAYEMRRLRPRAYNSTNRNAVQVPRGNLLALGARLERSLSPAVTLVPTVEFRHELAADSAASLALLGWLVRPGVGLRWRATGSVTLVVEGQAALGRLADGARSVPLVGPRALVLLEWRESGER